MFDDDRRRLFRGVLKAGAIDKQGSEGNARCAVMGRLADGFTGMAGDAAILINDKAVYAHNASPGCLASGDCLLMRRPAGDTGARPFGIFTVAMKDAFQLSEVQNEFLETH